MARFVLAFFLITVCAYACGGESDTVFGESGGGTATGSNTGGATGATNGNGNGVGTSSGAGGPGCDCDAPSIPVCGADGMPYDAGCGDQCVPVDIACRHACPCGLCQDLEMSYGEALRDAKRCEPNGGNTCTELMQNELTCPCNTFVNGANDEALAELEDLQSQWLQAGCHNDILCPDIACAEPMSAECDSSGQGSGTCRDNL